MTTPLRQMPHPMYRPDIDGLRALAVIVVVIFHAFPRSLRGGFIGVDIFFVISGYLISTIIFQSLDAGTFRFMDFYARRIRRIFPALLVVLTASLLLGWFVLLADEYAQLGHHIAAGAGFVSNFVLWRETGYFDTSAETKPLLHLWSLGIEEQFYIIWPFLVVFFWRWQRALPIAVAFLALLSFGLNVAFVHAHASAVFYLPLTRVWELLCGSLLAWKALYGRQRLVTVGDRLPSLAGLRSEALSLAGLALIVLALSRITKTTAFPGFWALVPVLAASLIISAGPDAWFNRVILSHPIAVWIGLISFPLYLWHWPLLSFAHLIEGEDLNRAWRYALVALAVPLAWSTYVLIERPIRFGQHARLKTAVAAAAMTAIGALGAATHLGDGFAFRKAAQTIIANGDVGHLGFFSHMADRYPLCSPEHLANEALKWEQFTRCFQSKPGDVSEIAIVGDSHAEHLFAGFAEAWNNKAIVYYAKLGPPFLSNTAFANIFKMLAERSTIKTVVIAMHWIALAPESRSHQDLTQELLRLTGFLREAGKAVILMDDVPEFSFSALTCRRVPVLETRTRDCSDPVSKATAQSAPYRTAMAAVLKAWPDVGFIETQKYFCQDGQCSMRRGTTILYRDRNHLNLEGSRFLASKIRDDHPDLFR